MRILFVCKYNRFRSKVAEAYFNKINRNKKIKAESAGIIEVNKPLSKSEFERNSYIKEKFGLVFNTKSRGINVKLLEKSDKLIVVANDIPKLVFNNPNDRRKLEQWNIKDEPAANKANINKIVKAILRKVDELNFRYKNY